MYGEALKPYMVRLDAIMNLEAFSQHIVNVDMFNFKPWRDLMLINVLFDMHFRQIVKVSFTGGGIGNIHMKPSTLASNWQTNSHTCYNSTINFRNVFQKLRDSAYCFPKSYTSCYDRHSLSYYVIIVKIWWIYLGKSKKPPYQCINLAMFIP